MSPLQIHNTLSGRKEDFQPLAPGRVKMYVCGVTPYDECHLGHARCYVTFDFIRRALKHLGYAVTCVQNFTDIDDKIIQRAKELGEEPAALAERHIQDYFDKMDQLNVFRADLYPRVTQHIPHIIDFIERLLKKGFAYRIEGDLYYAVRKFPSYTQLSKRNLDDLKSGARVEVDERKNDPLDFALWKAAKPGEPAWDSPWGRGRPGWHIECSVMSIVNLGSDTFDIHGGGQDLIFPHHTNEIAQAEGATGKPFANYWIHNGFVTINKEKMSKSLGNFFTLGDIFKRFEPRIVRFFLLAQDYHRPLEFSDENLTASAYVVKEIEEDFNRLSAVLRSQRGTNRQDEKELEKHMSVFEDKLKRALEDDFSSPGVLAAIFYLLDELKARTATHKAISTSGLEKGLKRIRDTFQDILGVPLSQTADEGDSLVKDLIDRREKARKSKNWEEADRLRRELDERRVIVEDTPQGPRWWKKN